MTRAAELVKDLHEGASVALVTDAGMPGISDPGFRMISLAIRHHVPVVPIPGASAFLAALVASGLPTDSFRFSGFLPAKRGERRAALEAILQEMRAAFIEEHAAFLVNESLQKLQFSFCELHRCCSERTHIDLYCGEAPKKSSWGGDDLCCLLESFELRAVQQLGNV